MYINCCQNWSIGIKHQSYTPNKYSLVCAINYLTTILSSAERRAGLKEGTWGLKSALPPHRPSQMLSSACCVPDSQTSASDTTRPPSPGRVHAPCPPPASPRSPQHPPTRLQNQPSRLPLLDPAPADSGPIWEPKNPAAEPVLKAQTRRAGPLFLGPKPRSSVCFRAPTSATRACCQAPGTENLFSISDPAVPTGDAEHSHPTALHPWSPTRSFGECSGPAEGPAPRLCGAAPAQAGRRFTIAVSGFISPPSPARPGPHPKPPSRSTPAGSRAQPPRKQENQRGYKTDTVGKGKEKDAETERAREG